MPGGSRSAGLNNLLGAAFALGALWPAAATPCVAASLHVTWASNTEADLAGYRLRYGTSPGSYTGTIDAGRETTCEISGLQPGVLYHIALFAFDVAGNESAPSAEVTARIPVSLAPLPTVASASEGGTRSIYLVRARTSFAYVYGEHFKPGATLGLGPGLTTGLVLANTLGSMLTTTVAVDPAAPLGDRTVTVTNPDQGTGGRSETLRVVKTPDIDTNCVVDVLDLNILARAWNESEDEVQFVPGADLDGDGYVGPDDLTVFVQYFGRAYGSCP